MSKANFKCSCCGKYLFSAEHVKVYSKTYIFCDNCKPKHPVQNLIAWFKKVFSSQNVVAANGSVACGGDNNATIAIFHSPIKVA